MTRAWRRRQSGVVLITWPYLMEEPQAERWLPIFGLPERLGLPWNGLNSETMDVDGLPLFMIRGNPAVHIPDLVKWLQSDRPAAQQARANVDAATAKAVS